MVFTMKQIPLALLAAAVVLAAPASASLTENPLDAPTSSDNCRTVPEPWCEIDPVRIYSRLARACSGDATATTLCRANIVLEAMAPGFASLVCSRQAGRTVVGLHPLLGTCASSTIWIPPNLAAIVEDAANSAGQTIEDAGETIDNADQTIRDAGRDILNELGPAAGIIWRVVETVLGAVDLVQGLIDEDRDGIPDEAEPILCFVEDDTSNQDGSCQDGNYSPP